ncbi:MULTISPECIES: tail fiber assembly protein [unclassified Pseudomonas]|uniref:tail fiber assembly protein n=1 Tax=unclassified Pseudomonas TaxID=196821 RepID=UPI0037F5C1AA
MKYYVDEDGMTYGFEDDGSQDFLITESMRPLTDQELDALLNPPVDYVAIVQAEILRLRFSADQAIAPLQDAVEFGRADQAKQDLLRAWRNYRIDLSEVPEQAGYPTDIDWPAPPA